MHNSNQVSINDSYYKTNNNVFTIVCLVYVLTRHDDKDYIYIRVYHVYNFILDSSEHRCHDFPNPGVWYRYVV